MIEERKTKPCSQPATSGGSLITRGNDARRLHDGGAGGAAEGVLAFQLDGEIQALVEHAREGMGGVEADRGKHRHQLAKEDNP